MKSKKLAPNGEKYRVKAFMVKSGIKQSAIASRLDLSPSTVSLVVSGKKKSTRVRREIATTLGMEVSELWPERKDS